MRRIMHRGKVIFSKIGWYFCILGWAKTHSKEVDNYRFLSDLRNLAQERKLQFEREGNDIKVEKLNIQIDLIDKILNYVSN